MYKIAALFLYSFILQAQNFNLFQKSLPSQFLQTKRDIYVYLPINYSSNHKPYPIIFMHDGQNLYDYKRSAFGKTWDMENTLNSLIDQNIIPPVIVVGIDNTNERTFEYTPSFDIAENIGGGANQYLKFLTQELLPLVENNFNVSRDKKDRALIGSSLGGLVSLYSLKDFSPVFGLIAALSPSLWWNNYEIFQIIKTTNLSNLKIYFDSGTQGGEKPQDVLKLEYLLKNKGIPNSNLKVVIDEGAIHDELAWAKRIPYALYFLFGQL